MMREASAVAGTKNPPFRGAGGVEARQSHVCLRTSDKLTKDLQDRPVVRGDDRVGRVPSAIRAIWSRPVCRAWSRLNLVLTDQRPVSALSDFEMASEARVGSTRGAIRTFLDPSDNARRAEFVATVQLHDGIRHSVKADSTAVVAVLAVTVLAVALPSDDRDRRVRWPRSGCRR